MARESGVSAIGEATACESEVVVVGYMTLIEDFGDYFVWEPQKAGGLI
jgi:hypothetical protein